MISSKRLTRLAPVHILSLTLLLLSSCSISKIAMKKMTGALTESSGVAFTGDDDPELIREALPFTIKLYESLVLKDSTNAQLNLATAKLLCLYSQYFVLAPADTMHDQAAKKAIGKRAKKLFLRAREYSLTSLDLTAPGRKNAIIKSSIDSALAPVTKNEASALYWTAVSWLGAIGSDRSDISLALGIKKPVSIAKKVIALDSAFDEGVAHELLGIATINLPASLGGGLDIAEYYFQRAVQLSKNSRVSSYVLYANLVAVKRGNREQFTALLHEAQTLNISSFPANRLQNSIYQEKARVMINNVNSFFPDSTGGIQQ